MTVSILRVQRGEIPLAEQYSDYTVFQTEPWITFLQETQGGEPVYAKVVLGQRVIGRFVGLMVRKFGIPILGSPMRGWTTSYMGFNLGEDISRLAALQALVRFAFEELKCLHLEIFDRNFDSQELTSSTYQFSYQSSFEI
ncbi:MAG: lipid II:glycine glycyltransferase FemX, partial [Halobacteriota archaeon]